MSLCKCERFWSKWPWLKASSPELHIMEQSWFTREVESWNCYFCPWVSSATTDVSITLINSTVLASPMVLTMWHLHIKIVWPNKMLLTQRFCKTCCWLLIGIENGNRYVPEKSVINMILLFPVFDWRIIMIGPGGLLLVVSHLFCSPSFRLMGGVGKPNMDPTNIFAGSHIEHWWRCFNII